MGLKVSLRWSELLVQYFRTSSSSNQEYSVGKALRPSILDQIPKYRPCISNGILPAAEKSRYVCLNAFDLVNIRFSLYAVETGSQPPVNGADRPDLRKNMALRLPCCLRFPKFDNTSSFCLQVVFIE